MEETKTEVKEKKCAHVECVRPGQKEHKGYCTQCIQLKSKACNYCLHSDGRIGEDKNDSKFWMIVAIIMMIALILVAIFS